MDNPLIMSNPFTIHQLGHPVLRQHAPPVENLTDPQFQIQLDALMDFVMAQGGMGIAAPQVGISQRFFILSSHPNERYPYAPDVPPFFVINPEILDRSEQNTKDWEGCLSLPGIRGLVPRANHIQVRYQNRMGDWIKASYEGFLARVFQHEYDHLIGHVFIDRVTSTQDIMMEAEWRSQILSHQG
jgi:peptide deformylase